MPPARAASPTATGGFVVVARRELGGLPWPPRRTRSAAGWTARRPSRAGSTVPGAPFDLHQPVVDLEVLRDRPRGRRRRSAAPSPARSAPPARSRCRSSPRPGRRTCRRRSRSAGCRRWSTSMSSIGTPSSSATICANAVSWPCPCEVSPVETSTLPLSRPARARPRTGRPGALDVAAPCRCRAAGRRRGACLAVAAKLVPADERLQLVQRAPGSRPSRR